MPDRQTAATDRLLALWDTLALEVGRAVLILSGMLATVGVISVAF